MRTSMPRSMVAELHVVGAAHPFDRAELTSQHRRGQTRSSQTVKQT